MGDSPLPFRFLLLRQLRVAPLGFLGDLALIHHQPIGPHKFEEVAFRFDPRGFE
jgi:hypothetical protein